MNRFIFLKPIARMVEGEIIQSIIAWDRKPWLYETVGNKTRIITYRNYIFIDLWFLKCRFIWNTTKKYE